MHKIIKKYALRNAIAYGGKANPKAVIGKVASKVKITSKIIRQIEDLIEEINVLGLDEQKLELEKIAPELLKKKKTKKEIRLPELKHTKNLVMRFAPFPSGALHIGNARPAVLNDEYCKKYKGKLLLFIDDTIGSKEKPILKEAYDLIPEGLKWLGCNIHKTYYKSDRLKIYYGYAEKLIKKKKAYVCHCSGEKIRENRRNKEECDCRSACVEENLKSWKKMFKAKEGSMVLRIKTSMQDKNPAFRDRVIFRISDRRHVRVGKKYRVWPMLDFSWAVDDYLLKINWIIRGKELRIETDMENYIWDIFGWKHFNIRYNGHLKLTDVKISKSKSREEVLSGKYIGWNDPRTWSLQSLRDRGIKPEALRNFLLKFGLNETEIVANVDDLYSENKKFVEVSNRYFFVANPKKIKISGAPEKKIKIGLHPILDNGFRRFKTKDLFYVNDDLKKGQLYRLMHLFNFKNHCFESFELNKDAKLIHWLPVSRDLIKINVLMPDGKIVKGVAEEDVGKIRIGDVCQFERFGFCCKVKNDLFFFSHR